MASGRAPPRTQPVSCLGRVYAGDVMRGDRSLPLMLIAGVVLVFCIVVASIVDRGQIRTQSPERAAEAIQPLTIPSITRWEIQQSRHCGCRRVERPSTKPSRQWTRSSCVQVAFSRPGSSSWASTSPLPCRRSRESTCCWPLRGSRLSRRMRQAATRALGERHADALGRNATRAPLKRRFDRVP
jgi:hypothetical protein